MPYWESTRNPVIPSGMPEFPADSGRILIHPDLSESGGNGGNLVGIIPSLSEIWVGSHQDN